jgi:hypothetical protein
MAVALVSTGVQFPDSTIQTTAASGGGGSFVYISTTTVGGVSNNLDITSGIDSTYGTYKLIIEYLYCGTADVDLRMRFYFAGSLSTASVYGYAAEGMQAGAGQNYYDRGYGTDYSGNLNGNGPMYIQNSITLSLKGEITLYNPSATNTKRMVNYNVSQPIYLSSGSNSQLGWNSGWVTHNEGSLALTGVRLYVTTGFIYAKVHLYGIKTS